MNGTLNLTAKKDEDFDIVEEIFEADKELREEKKAQQYKGRRSSQVVNKKNLDRLAYTPSTHMSVASPQTRSSYKYM